MRSNNNNNNTPHKPTLALALALALTTMSYSPEEGFDYPEEGTVEEKDFDYPEEGTAEEKDIEHDLIDLDFLLERCNGKRLGMKTLKSFKVPDGFKIVEVCEFNAEGYVYSYSVVAETEEWNEYGELL